MDNWDEVKTAYHVAILGTISAASETLGVHRATVIRHVDALEEKLGHKLFLRHSHGYTPTEDGLDLVKVVKVVDQQLNGLSNRIKGRAASLQGNLIITSLDVFAPLLMPSIAEFHAKYPNTHTTFIAAEELLRLEYGEAHIALRPTTDNIDKSNIILPFGLSKFGLFATETYVENNGLPKNVEEFSNHNFICRYGEPRAYFEKWLIDNVPNNNVALRSSTPFVLQQALLDGVGIGFMPIFMINNNPKLIQIMEPHKDWHVPLWLVIHSEIYKSEKVQTFLEILEKNNEIKAD